MLRESEGIILRSKLFKDSSLILSTYTEAEGRMDFLAKGFRTANNKSKQGILQVGAVGHMVYYYREQRELQILNNYQPSAYLDQIFSDPVKILYNYLIAEIFLNAVREQESNPELYRFHRSALTGLEEARGGYYTILFRYLIELLRFLGIQPDLKLDPEAKQDLKGQKLYFAEEEGQILPAIERDEPTAKLIAQYLLTDQQDPSLPKAYRKQLLTILLRYLELHQEGFQQPKSLKVFEQVFQ